MSMNLKQRVKFEVIATDLQPAGGYLGHGETKTAAPSFAVTVRDVTKVDEGGEPVEVVKVNATYPPGVEHEADREVFRQIHFAGVLAQLAEYVGIGGILMLFVLVSACAESTTASTPDAALPVDAAFSDDAQEPASDAGQGEDAGEPVEGDSGPPADAWTPAPGTCSPDRVEGSISHNDCRRYADRPICDAITEQCTREPDALCGACETDAQCMEGVDLQARCVYMPGDSPTNDDSACLVPCGGDGDCSWIQAAYGWTAYGRCFDFPQGSFCAPDWGGRTHCRNPDGASRQGST